MPDDAPRLMHLTSQEAPLALFCFPPAGMGPLFYYSWAQHTSPDIHLAAIHLPGRDHHPHPHSPVDTLGLVTQLAHLIHTHTTTPFAFFGHSIGALLAYETTRHLHTHHQKTPVFLALSGCPAPHLDGLQRNITQAALDGLRTRTDVFPPLPNETTTLAERVTYCESACADSVLVLRHHHHDTPPLDTPFGLYCGDTDTFVSAEDIDRWNDLFTEPTNPHFYPGGHRYLPDANPLVSPQVLKDFTAALRAPQGRP
ncbi:thioesterase II family protein [Streptomyces syringium]|uniref:thioesterase II family protein n=1 Tax=Streptomyces syringium TaxID=76729 RepID=UPI0034528ED3